MDYSTKIFGIGLIKTGTMSVHKALNILGIPSIHHWEPVYAAVKALKDGDRQLMDKLLEQYDGVFDGDMSSVAKELADTYPEAKFIYTWRDKNQWITSQLIHVLHNRTFHNTN